ncbi:MAG: hypothetical protein ACKVZH_28790 [Blastocatellia bacterium]
MSQSVASITYRGQLLTELDQMPDEYLPFALQMMRTFRASVTLKPAVASFLHGWQETKRGETYPVEMLWDDVDADSLY